jgi:putative hemin transport protein
MATTKRSLQFFDAHGDAVHKVHARPATDLAAWAEPRRQSADHSEDQSDCPCRDRAGALPPGPSPAGPRPTATPCASTGGRCSPTPTSSSRHAARAQARPRLRSPRAWWATIIAWPLGAEAVPPAFSKPLRRASPCRSWCSWAMAAASRSMPAPIAHHHAAGPLAQRDGPRPSTCICGVDQVAAACGRCASRPSRRPRHLGRGLWRGSRNLIIQFFGKRHEGVDERPEWRALVEALAPVDPHRRCGLKPCACPSPGRLRPPSRSCRRWPSPAPPCARHGNARTLRRHLAAWSPSAAR